MFIEVIFIKFNSFLFIFLIFFIVNIKFILDIINYKIINILLYYNKFFFFNFYIKFTIQTLKKISSFIIDVLIYDD